MSTESTIPTPATPDVCTVDLLVEGTSIPGEYHVLSVAVRKEINRIPTATLVLRDGEASKATFQISNSDHFLPGNKVEIRLGYRSNNETVFKGVVIKQGISIRKSGSILTVECRDEAVKMTCGAKSRYYTDMKDSDIMEQVIASYGLDKDVQATKPDLKEVTQYNATDWDFLLCRAEANGQVVIVSDGKVSVSQPAASDEPVLSVGYGSTLLELDAEIDARRQSTGVVARSWSGTDQDVLEAEAKEPAKTVAGNLAPDALAKVLGSDPYEMRHGGKLTTPELQAWADGRLLRERLAKVRGRAKFQGFAKVAPGKVMEVNGIGERFQGRFYVAGVRHAVDKGNWETDVQFGLSTESFAETFDLRPLPASGLLPAVSGLHMGVVTVLENDPQGEDRIKVRLPLVNKAEEGLWARLATLDAGNKRGTFFRPEIGDEVVVGFLGDDPCHPVVLGMCNSSAKPAPEPAKDRNHRKGYVSRSKLKFTFDDQNKVVLLETPGGNRLALSEADKGIVIKDQNGNKIIMDNTGVRIESSKDLTLKAAKNVSIEASASLSLKAQTSFKAEGTASAEVSGASTTVKGSAKTVIQGGIVQIN
ncbi:phage protein D and tail spike protein, putative [Citrifermentans bemidjiense Bem]|uniref:Phage protein D and tail spike protein, putative n=1 Tax=Citrifermentans bemidjiense (strain ATCC BAA-1014 / DSM 16622 / JCM 12645 / Bem) TaxID=404380 RepID=B5EGS5_CITBB|nr:type VI secretion system tip protein VgrG [Citrifermentans bemidjiense]ACH39558.1 phage protein D and tail spike protein, putative [Citrifermentans bemidjiense Bem]